METKDRIRSRFLALRDSMEPESVRTLGLAAAERAVGILESSGAAWISLYAEIRNEVATGPIFERMRERGIHLCFPRLAPGGIEFVEIGDLSELEEGRWGIREPKKGAALSTGKLDLVVVPGVAFDLGGRRIGFGQGYYDRALSGFHGVLAGLGYDFQVVEEIPFDAGDLRCRWVVTDRRAIRAS